MLSLHPRHSFFLFGARGVGKSTLVEHCFAPNQEPATPAPQSAVQQSTVPRGTVQPHSSGLADVRQGPIVGPVQGGQNSSILWCDLLLHEQEERLSQQPDHLIHMVHAGQYNKVIIDEVQKIPKLLDVVQKLMHTHKHIQFIMTGSSARKLKRGAGNMLAGRAFTYYLFPFSMFELAAGASVLHDVLEWGSLPSVWNQPNNEDKKLALSTYVHTYLKEEVLVEQLVRDLNPFRNFLSVAAQHNAEPLNFSNMARDVGVDDKTIKNYFSILEDTCLGFLLPSYHPSVRKQQLQAPKFYFFDTGVTRALSKQTAAPLLPGTYAYGRAFEHRVFLEVFYLNHYLQKDFNLYYLKTKSGVEVDLIIERPGEPDLLVEIKSTQRVQQDHLRGLAKMQSSWPKACRAQLWSQDLAHTQQGTVECLHWYHALKKLFSMG